MDVDDGFQPHKIVLTLVGRLVGAFFVALRFYARRKAGAHYWWDDWLCLGCILGLLLPVSILDLWQVVDLGWGRSIMWLGVNRPENLPAFAKAQYADLQFYAPVVVCIKCSILCLYIRTFGIRKSLTRLCQAQIVLVCVWGVVVLLLFLLQCRPVHLGWSVDRSSGTCLEYRSLFIGTNVVNVLADFAVLVTPLPYIWSLQLRTVNKAMVSGVLVLGTGACVFSTVRLVKLSKLTFQDPSLDGMEGTLWSSLEGNFGLICACLPTLGPLLPRWASGRTTKNSRATGYNSNGYRKQDSPDAEHSAISQDDDARELVNRPPPGNITRTTEWDVYDERNVGHVEMHGPLAEGTSRIER